MVVKYTHHGDDLVEHRAREASFGAQCTNHSANSMCIFIILAVIRRIVKRMARSISAALASERHRLTAQKKRRSGGEPLATLRTTRLAWQLNPRPRASIAMLSMSELTGGFAH